MTNPAALPVDAGVLWAVGHALHYDPHSVLGPHLYDGAVTIRTLRPLADSVSIVTPDGKTSARHEQDGIWVAVIATDQVPDYRVEVTYGDLTTLNDDPYRFAPTLGDLDMQLIREGRHEELWRALGARMRHYPSVMGDVTGASFAVWAPDAQGVRVIGDFNSWNSEANAMRSLGSSGVWEIFVPGVTAGNKYKYEIHTRQGDWIQKADPMARAAEKPPATASIVEESAYQWGDQAWLAERAAKNPHNQPMSVYEVHLGSWQEGLTYRDLASQLVDYVATMGFTHVEFMPVAEHPYTPSWGYQVTGYYAPTSRYGTPDDFRYLVDKMHQAGIGVILDWVPAHFPKDAFALARFDGSALYEYPDPQRGEHPDWGTLVFNFGRTEVRNFLVANANYWFEEFHADGLRVDAVASMLYLDYSRQPGQWSPNVYGGRENLEAISFLQETTATAYKRYPGVMLIAEESTAWPGVTAATSSGGLGFGLKWNMGWMNDTLRYLREDPVNRRYHHGEITFSLVYAFSENYCLPLSHDEVVHGKGSLYSKMPGDNWQKLANLRVLYAYMWSHPGKQLLFMGSELGQTGEWSEQWSLDWWLLDQPDRAGLAALVKELNLLYRSHPALWDQDSDPATFEWIDADDAGRNVLAYSRKPRQGRPVVAVINFAGVPHEGYRLALPQGGKWKEILNTDAPFYGGSGVGNLGLIQAEPVPWYGRNFSASIRVPPLGAVWFEPEA
ncbi:MAG: 1,4-alpha-glucan branching protein GlgB [Bifidobacteriaceae bacterium]|jgi:1,4-alpha-glucan branching enzyme|nr:1,4-alpha-glucan branching protein GlgB [Bifidobacteriaceae bacterium]